MLDSIAGKKSSLALLAGTYPLAAPLGLTNKHNGLTLEACGGQVILQAAASDLTPFALGMIQLGSVGNFTLRGLTLQMSGVGAAGAAQSCIGVLARNAPNLTVESCTFAFPAPAKVVLTGYGLVVIDTGTGLAVRRCTFTGGSYPTGSAVWGVWAPSSSLDVTTTLDGVEISDNTFRQLGAAVVVFAQLGLVRCANNRVTSCGTGIYFADNSLGATGETARQSLAETDASRQLVAGALNIGLQAPMLSDSAASFDTILKKLPSPPTAPVVSDTLRTTLTANFTTQATASWNARILDVPNFRLLALSSTGTPAATSGTVGVAASAPATQPAATLLPAGVSDTIIKALNVTQQIALASAVASRGLTPVLHISGNDVTLAAVAATALPTASALRSCRPSASTPRRCCSARTGC